MPVSPEVAVTIITRPSPSASPARAMSRGSICRATSLKALVGPWKSSSTETGESIEPVPNDSSGTRGVTSGLAKVPS